MSRKEKRNNKKKIIIFIIVLVIIIAGIVFILNKREKNILLGSWDLNGTIYEFKEKNKGIMKVPLSEYPFTYTINEKKVFIDMENEKSYDYEYEFSVEDNKLTLVRSDGTFIFTRIEN